MGALVGYFGCGLVDRKLGFRVFVVSALDGCRRFKEFLSANLCGAY